MLLSSEPSNIVKELQVLGWTEEGAKRYAENFLRQNNSDQLINNLEIILIIILIIFSILGTLIFFLNKNSRKSKEPIKLYKEKKIKESSLDKLNANTNHIQVVETSKEVSDKVVSTKKILNSLIKLKEETSIDINVIVEHFLLLFVLSFELLINLFKFLNLETLSIFNLSAESHASKNNKSLNHTEEIFYDKKFRKVQLMRMKNIELKRMLIGKPNISKLKKSELVEKILNYEYIDSSDKS